MLLDAIGSLQLSTQDGSFVFASNSVSDKTSLLTPVCSTGCNSIKTLPSTVWLSPSSSVKQQHQQRPCIFSHILSLPINAYLVSSSSSFGATATKRNQPFNRIPMVNHLLCLPIDAFKPSSNTSASIKIKNNKNLYVFYNFI
jgi:hypothetical protein